RDRAGGGVRVQGREDEVTGKARLDRDFGGFEVTDFADHHDVRILAQYGPEAAGEGHFDLGIDLRLADTVDEVLDRVFDRHDVAAVVVDALQGRVQGGRLAGTGGPGDEYDPVGLVDQLVHHG